MWYPYITKSSRNDDKNQNFFDYVSSKNVYKNILLNIDNAHKSKNLQQNSHSSEIDDDLRTCLRCGLNKNESKKRLWIRRDQCMGWHHSTCVKLTKNRSKSLNFWVGPCCTPKIINDTQPFNFLFSFLRVGAVLKQVPKASRIPKGNLPTSILNKIVAENSLTAWKNLFSYSSKCLLDPNRSGKKSESLEKIINRQISDFVYLNFHFITRTLKITKHFNFAHLRFSSLY